MLYYTLRRLDNTEKIVSWKFKNFSAEKLITPTTTDKNLSPSIKSNRNSNFCLVFKGSCLKQKIEIYTPPNRIIFLLFMNKMYGHEI